MSAFRITLLLITTSFTALFAQDPAPRIAFSHTRTEIPPIDVIRLMVVSHCGLDQSAAGACDRLPSERVQVLEGIAGKQALEIHRLQPVQGRCDAASDLADCFATTIGMRRDP